MITLFHLPLILHLFTFLSNTFPEFPYSCIRTLSVLYAHHSTSTFSFVTFMKTIDLGNPEKERIIYMYLILPSL